MSTEYGTSKSRYTNNEQYLLLRQHLHGLVLCQLFPRVLLPAQGEVVQDPPARGDGATVGEDALPR
jgi:hypothetical protein